MGDPARRLYDYVASVAAAVASHDGAALAGLLQITGGSPAAHRRQGIAAGFEALKGQDTNRLAQKVEKSGLADALLPHMQAMQAFHLGQFVASYTHLLQSANAFLQEVRNWESAWGLEPLHVVVYDLRTIAEKADEEMAAQGKPPDKLKGACTFFMKAFGALAQKGAKRVGALYLACQLFKMYFKLGTEHLCKSIIRVIDAQPGFENYPARDQVTYKYYCGRLDVFNDNFIEADEKLTYALKRCHRRMKGNIRRILVYLIPVRLCLGSLPRDSLLKTHQLPEYAGIVQAMKRGDVRLLRETLQAHEDKLLRAGVYLVLEKLELQVYRRLYKRMHLVQKQGDPARAHQLRMDAIVRALTWLGVQMDVDEVECITATMIYKGYIKGYFSHKSKVVVLSKQDPFPKLSGKLAII